MNLIEVAFNKILRRIWKLPFNSHTRIVHSTAHLLSLFNVVSAHSLSLLSSALSCPSFPVSFIYRVSSNLVYTPCGFNCLCGHIYKKTYYPEDLFCANIIRDTSMMIIIVGASLSEQHTDLHTLQDLSRVRTSRYLRKLLSVWLHTHELSFTLLSHKLPF